jgi:hypothetical protein
MFVSFARHPARVAGIHVFIAFEPKTWMAGTKPGHDALSLIP